MPIVLRILTSILVLTIISFYVNVKRLQVPVDKSQIHHSVIKRHPEF